MPSLGGTVKSGLCEPQATCIRAPSSTVSGALTLSPWSIRPFGLALNIQGTLCLPCPGCPKGTSSTNVQNQRRSWISGQSSRALYIISGPPAPLLCWLLFGRLLGVAALLVYMVGSLKSLGACPLLARVCESSPAGLGGSCSLWG